MELADATAHAFNTEPCRKTTKKEKTQTNPVNRPTRCVMYGMRLQKGE
jgi:hypothetical protein